ncbi:MAG: hypothetical protein Q7J28_00980 [Caulobacter sp.]|nr:hypothetical protein [Caulobacter sp.]
MANLSPIESVLKRPLTAALAAVGVSLTILGFAQQGYDIWTGGPEAWMLQAGGFVLFVIAVSILLYRWEKEHHQPALEAKFLASQQEVAATLMEINKELLAIKIQVTGVKHVTDVFPRYQEETTARFEEAFDQIGGVRGENIRNHLAVIAATESVGEIRVQLTRGLEHLRRAALALRDQHLMDNLFVQIVQAGEELLAPERAMGPLGIDTAEWERDFTLMWENRYGDIISLLLPYHPSFIDGFRDGRLAGQLQPEDQALVARAPSKERFIRDIRGVAAKIADLNSQNDHFTALATGPLTDQVFWAQEPTSI